MWWGCTGCSGWVNFTLERVLFFSLRLRIILNDDNYCWCFNWWIIWLQFRSSFLFDVHFQSFEAKIIEGQRHLQLWFLYWFIFGGFFLFFLEGNLFFFVALVGLIFFGWQIAIDVFVFAELEVFVALQFGIFEVVEHLLLLVYLLRLFCWIFFLELDFDLIGTGKFLFSLDGFDSIFFQNVFLSDDDLSHVSDHSFLDLQVDF